MRPAIYKTIIALYCVLCFTGKNALAEQTPLLDGIRAAVLMSYVDKTIGGKGEICTMPSSELDTALMFVASQSTNLRIISDKQAGQAMDEISVKLSQKWDLRSEAEKEARQVAMDRLAMYGAMPVLVIILSPIQTHGECAGSIRASLLAPTSPAKIKATGRVVDAPRLEIWSDSFKFVGPLNQRDFSKQATGLAEQVVKGLVNDWTASQENNRK